MSAPRPREQVLATLRAQFAEQRFRPGDRLPPERTLAAELGVSRAVLRGALAVLEAEGRIWRGVGQGTFVGGRPVDAPDRVADVADLTSPAEVMEVRLALEPELARLAAHRANNRELDEVARCCGKAASARTQGTYEQWDGRFHHAIATAAHNRLFLALFEALNAVRTHTAWGRAREARRSASWQRRTAKQHDEILQALRRRNAAAAQALMRTHLEAVREHLLDAEGARIDAAN
ncbi:MAG: FCD domain-containing protein [Trueperaceae bacterium]|nr:FCD domain-containing protein [Trueperaceae bacterium]